MTIPLSGRWVKSRHANSLCRVCRQPVVLGARIWYEKKIGVTHAECKDIRLESSIQKVEVVVRRPARRP
jgi:hypothetical protein